MKKYIYILLVVFVGLTESTYGQGTVGINQKSPNVTFEINSNNPNSPNSTDGIIVPRVTSLNVTEPKEIGLLVFYESSGNNRGFYWWDGVQWWPFISVTQITPDLTIAHAFCKNTFREGDITGNVSTNLRTIEFDGLQTNDTSNYEINSNGELVVKRGGKYHVYGVVYVRNVSSVVNADKRDAIEAKLFINGADASSVNSNLNIEGANGFPTGNNTIVVFLSGAIILNDNDRLLYKVNRYFRDADPNIALRPDPESLSNLTLRYLGPQ